MPAIASVTTLMSSFGNLVSSPIVLIQVGLPMYIDNLLIFVHCNNRSDPSNIVILLSMIAEPLVITKWAGAWMNSNIHVNQKFYNN